MSGFLRQWKDSEVVFISAIQHYSYCPRQCGLIHIEQMFDENIYTMRGNRIHETVDSIESSLEKGIQVERGLPLWSESYGLVGKADIVEFYGEQPYPVEYKYGSRQKKTHDDLQLCAQALCLEEMLGVDVSKGAIFHYSSRRRREVIFTDKLRWQLKDTIINIREMLNEGLLPPPSNDERCRNCSLLQSCMPQVTGKNRN